MQSIMGISKTVPVLEGSHSDGGDNTEKISITSHMEISHGP